MLKHVAGIPLYSWSIREVVSSDMWLECVDAWLEGRCQFVRNRDLTLELRQARQRQLITSDVAGSHHAIQELNKHLHAR